MLGQSYGWLGQDTKNGGKTLVLDSWERRGGQNTENDRLFEVFYSRFASIAQQEHQIAKITFGVGLNTPKVNSFDIETQPIEPRGERLYGDSIRQYTIADSERGINSEDLPRMIKRKLILGVLPEDIENDYIKLCEDSNIDPVLKQKVTNLTLEYTIESKHGAKSYNRLFNIMLADLSNQNNPRNIIDLDIIKNDNEKKLLKKIQESTPLGFIKGNSSFDICTASSVIGYVKTAKEYMQYLDIEHADTKNITQFFRMLGENNHQSLIDNLSILENIPTEFVGKLIQAAIESKQISIAKEIMKFSNIKTIDCDFIADYYELALKYKQPDLAKEIIEFPKAKEMSGDSVANCFVCALKNNYLDIAKEIIEFPKAKEMDGYSASTCFISALNNNQFDIAKEIINFFKTKDIDGYSVSSCFISALEKNQFDIAKEIISFSKAKEMNGSSVSTCFISALKNNQPDIAKYVMSFPKAKDMKVNFIINCFSAALENNEPELVTKLLGLSNAQYIEFFDITDLLEKILIQNNIESNVKSKLAIKLLDLPDAQYISKYDITDLLERILIQNNIESNVKSELAIKFLELPSIKEDYSGSSKSICGIIINNDKLYPELLEKALNNKNIRSNLEFLNELKTNAEGKGKTEASEMIQSFIVKAVARSEQLSMSNVPISAYDLPSEEKTSFTQRLKDNTNSKKDNIRRPN